MASPVAFGGAGGTAVGIADPVGDADPVAVEVAPWPALVVAPGPALVDRDGVEVVAPGPEVDGVGLGITSCRGPDGPVTT